MGVFLFICLSHSILFRVSASWCTWCPYILQFSFSRENSTFKPLTDHFFLASCKLWNYKRLFYYASKFDWMFVFISILPYFSAIHNNTKILDLLWSNILHQYNIDWFERIFYLYISSNNPFLNFMRFIVSCFHRL